MGWVILIILVLISAFFSSAETALILISKIRIAKLVEEKKRGAAALQKLRAKPGLMLNTILIGNNIVNIGASVLAASLAFEYFKDHFQPGTTLAISIVTGIMTLIILIFGEIAPKTIALRKSEKYALMIAPIIQAIEAVFKPLVYVLTFITRPMVALFGPSTEKGLTEEEIRMVISAGEKAGIIEEEEKQMISSIFDFGDTRAKEVMTPRPDIKAIETNQSLANLKLLIKQVGRSRIPVYEGNLDNIVGVVYAKDLIAKDGNTIKDYVRDILIVPETKKIDELMRQMQSVRGHMAVTVDEYGVTSGIVTLEDLLEEIVGEIHDEFERGFKRIEKIDNQTWLVDANLSIDDMKRELDIALPEGDYDTVAGFVLSQLGKFPSIGDEVSYNRIILEVEKTYRRRITRLKIKKIKSYGEEMVGG